MDLMLELLPLFKHVDGSMLKEVVGAVVVYLVARKEVRAQFHGVVTQVASLNESLKNIAEELKSFGKQMIDLETKHNARISMLEVRMNKFEKNKGD